jgi:hypothetical protein
MKQAQTPNDGAWWLRCCDIGLAKRIKKAKKIEKDEMR